MKASELLLFVFSSSQSFWACFFFTSVFVSDSLKSRTGNYNVSILRRTSYVVGIHGHCGQRPVAPTWAAGAIETDWLAGFFRWLWEEAAKMGRSPLLQLQTHAGRGLAWRAHVVEERSFPLFPLSLHLHLHVCNIGVCVCKCATCGLNEPVVAKERKGCMVLAWAPPPTPPSKHPTKTGDCPLSFCFRIFPLLPLFLLLLVFSPLLSWLFFSGSSTLFLFLFSPHRRAAMSGSIN